MPLLGPATVWLTSTALVVEGDVWLHLEMAHRIRSETQLQPIPVSQTFLPLTYHGNKPFVFAIDGGVAY